MAEKAHCSHDRAFLPGTIIANPVIYEAKGEGAVSVLQVSWDGPESKPGQFFMLRLLRSGVLLGRPISVLDHQKGILSFLVAERGTGSRELVQGRPGETIELAGPLGNTWPSVPDSIQVSASGPISAEHKPIALVGGGIGIAPLLFLSRTMDRADFRFFAGFRSRPYGLESLPSQILTVATEDGSAGHRGRIPDFFNPADYRVVYACGPTPMLKRIAGDCAQAAVPCFISLEERMACGVGACLGCTVRTKQGNRRCCADGPIFPAEEVLFDD